MNAFSLETPVVTTTGEIALASVAWDPSEDGLLLLPHYLGICGTDKAIVAGTRTAAARILGHELVAQVAAVGMGIVGFKVGDIVTLNPNIDAATVLGEARNGVFSGILSAPRAWVEAGLFFRVPTGLPPLAAVLAEPVACVAHAWEQLASLANGRSIAILGAGQFARYHILMAKGHGAKKISVWNRGSQRLAALEAAKVMRPEERLRDGEGGFDVVVLAVSSGGAALLDHALALVKDGGTVFLWGGFSRGDVLRLPSGEAVGLWEIRDTKVSRTISWGEKTCILAGSRGASRRHFERAFWVLANHWIKPEHIVERLVGFARLPEALAAQDGGKVVVDAALWNEDFLLHDYGSPQAHIRRCFESGLGGTLSSGAVDVLAPSLFGRLRLALAMERKGLSFEEERLLDVCWHQAQESYRGADGAWIRFADGTPLVVHAARLALFLVEKLRARDPVLIGAALLHDAKEYGAPCGFAGALPETHRARILEIVDALTQDRALPEGLMRKQEHYLRLLSTDLECARLKIADNLVGWSTQGAKGSVKSRSVSEVALFINFAEAVFRFGDATLLRNLLWAVLGVVAAQSGYTVEEARSFSRKPQFALQPKTPTGYLGARKPRRKFSILVVCDRYLQRLTLALRNWIHQEGVAPEDYEVVVSSSRDDDGVRNLLDQLSAAYPRHTFLTIENSPTQTKLEYQNAMLDAASGEVICLVDADMVYPTTFLSRIAEMGPEDGVLVWIGRAYLNREQTARAIVGDISLTAPGFFDKPLHGELSDSILYERSPSGYCHVYTRRTFDRAGGFDGISVVGGRYGVFASLLVKKMLSLGVLKRIHKIEDMVALHLWHGEDDSRLNQHGTNVCW